jgi:pimeloyl-ACP methyl ester carboxylesterase
MPITKSQTVVFITGAFVSHYGWSQWKNYFDSEGYQTYIPAWPYKDDTARELRNKHPNFNLSLARLTVNDLVNHYVRIIKCLPEKPIVIGHSLGGLITQILVNRNLVAAGIAIHSLPPAGVVPYEFSSLRAGWKSLGLFTSTKKTYLMSFKDWQYAFVNGMDEASQRETYEKYIIPESKTAVRGGLTNAAKIDFNKPHPPLLLMSGSIDHIVPASLNYRNYKSYKPNGSILDYKEFTGRNHFVLGQPGWQENADYILNWMIDNLPQNSFAPILEEILVEA